jgi:hypothetical protein
MGNPTNDHGIGESPKGKHHSVLLSLGESYF